MSSANGVTELVAIGQQVCLPGEAVLLLQDSAVVSIGSGLAHGGSRIVDGVKGDVLVAAVCGCVVKERGKPGAPFRYSIPCNSRYVPRKGDPVVATVLKALGSTYHMSIGAAHPALLDGCAFDGATKNSRPRLHVGDSVYCHVATCDPEMDVVVTCCAPPGIEAKEWTTGESVFGPLKGGAVIRVPLSYGRQLMEENALILSLLGQRVPYEICAGANGRVWVRGNGGGDGRIEQMRTVAVAACLTEGQFDGSATDIRARVESYFPSLQ